MPLLILESLGSTELLFILVMALVFFGPRKLPQLSRKLGKSLAEFRRASEDFKSTWEREVAIENPLVDPPASLSSANDDRSLFANGAASEPIMPTIHPVPPEDHIPREIRTAEEPTSNLPDDNGDVKPVEPTQKRDWL